MIVSLSLNGKVFCGELDLNKAQKVLRPGSRHGKYYIDKQGNVVYGERKLGHQAGLFDEPEEKKPTAEHVESLLKDSEKIEPKTPIQQANEKINKPAGGDLSETEKRVLMSFLMQGTTGRMGSMTKKQRLDVLNGLVEKGYLDKNANVTSKAKSLMDKLHNEKYGSSGDELSKPAPESKPAEQAGKAKEPWEISQKEYAKDSAGRFDTFRAVKHRNMVQQALNEDKNVPQNILDEYPGIKKEEPEEKPEEKPEELSNEARVFGYKTQKEYDDVLQKIYEKEHPKPEKPKEFWEKTRKEVIQEAKENLAYLKKQRAKGQKDMARNPVGKKNSAIHWDLKISNEKKRADADPKMHKVSVEQALKDGKSVPENVLKEYPDLKEKYSKQPATPIKDAAEKVTQAAGGDAAWKREMTESISDEILTERASEYGDQSESVKSKIKESIVNSINMFPKKDRIDGEKYVTGFYKNELKKYSDSLKDATKNKKHKTNAIRELEMYVKTYKGTLDALKKPVYERSVSENYDIDRKIKGYLDSKKNADKVDLPF